LFLKDHNMKFFKTKQNLQSGQAMITAVIFFLAISITIVLGIASPILKQVRIGNELIVSKQAYFSAQGGFEDVISRIQSSKQVLSTETLSINNGTVNTVTSDITLGKEVTSTATINGEVRKIQIDLILGTGVSFHYGIQAGNGGFVLDGNNSSKIIGNVFSGGTVVATGQGNYIYGDVISAGSSGLINGVHATGTAYAHTIQNSTIDKDAYYTTITGSTATGASCTGGTNTHCHPGSTDQDIAALPISDDQITEWESDAAAGGTSSNCSSGTYNITASTTIGPLKIPCNLTIKGATVTITGPIWVTGNIAIQTGSTVKMDSSLGDANVAIIADNTTNRLTSSLIDLTQQATFQGSGSSDSYIFLISQNNSSENGGSTDAISLGQGASGVIGYASHGQITLSQSANLKEVTAYKIVLTNSAVATYDRGLPSVLFNSGPTGGYSILTWKEVQ
jgi:hypothetical protein